MKKNIIILGLFITFIFGITNVKSQEPTAQKQTQTIEKKDGNSDLKRIITDNSGFYLSLISLGALLIVTVLGLLKWNDIKAYCLENIKVWLKTEIESGRLDLGLDQKFKNISGRLDAAVGLTMGRSSYNPKTRDLIREDMYDLAIIFSKRGYEALKDCDSPDQWKAANNLAFYYSLPKKPKVANSIHAAELAKIIRGEYNFFQDEPWARTTYALVVSAYPTEFTPKEINDACSMMNEIINDDTMNSMWGNEAESSLKKLKEINIHD